MVNLTDIIRERREHHILMILAGSFGILASMWVEKSLNTTNIFNCFSTHFFLFQGIATFFYHKELRSLLPRPFRNALWLADSSFFLGGLMQAILSYFYFQDNARENLALARSDGFSILLFLFAACIFLMTTPVAFAKNTKQKPYIH